MSAMVTVLAGMPDLWMRELREHCPDEDGRCLSCSSNKGRARWPCLPRRIAEQAANVGGAAPEASVRSVTRPPVRARPRVASRTPPPTVSRGQ
jgi:kynureninase